MQPPPFVCLKGLGGTFSRDFPCVSTWVWYTQRYHTPVFHDAIYTRCLFQNWYCQPRVGCAQSSLAEPVGFLPIFLFSPPPPQAYYLLLEGACSSALGAFNLTPPAVREQRFFHLPEMTLISDFQSCWSFPPILTNLVSHFNEHLGGDRIARTSSQILSPNWLSSHCYQTSEARQ